MVKNDQFTPLELRVLLHELQAVIEKKVPGDIVELGCYKGLTSVEMQRILSKSTSQKQLYLYDSFEGLPPKGAEDMSPAGEQFKPGELPANKKEVAKLFKQAGLPTPFIKKTWFSELTPNDLPQCISLAFLDGDFYSSIRDSLKLVWPLLSEGAVVVVDDYQNEALPGAAKAVDEWLKFHKATLRTEASLGVITLK